ncbi:ATP-binding protein [Microbacterium luticocti]|uniref:ATP-binding protein n=1 Tax=Microbacterium luticocti TaxID=451764 RepID=UPI0004121634|nr:ATP-binding protein [Microbacterium luticocti]
MDALSNPFTPNAGAMPPLMVGRDDKLDSFRTLLGRLARGRTEQSMMITGLRGVGKTVLLNAFRRMAAETGWAVIELEISKHSDDEFRTKLAAQMRQVLLEISPRSRWREKAHLAARVLRSFTLAVDPDGRLTIGMTPDAEEGRADSGNLSLDLPELLVAIGEAASEAGKGVVILLDEVQFLSKEQLEAAVMGVHKTVQRALPITLVGAGLPQIAELAGEAKSYSERLFTFPSIDVLSDDDAREALSGPIRNEGAAITTDALDLALEVTGRYPYFLQELGYAAWAEADHSPITREDVRTATVAFEDKLDGSFFRVRLDRTTDLERAYLRAMAELGPQPQSAADVAALLGRSSQQCGPTRSQLVEKGLLYTPSHGYAAFTVPHFDRFMKRAVPVLDVPAIRPRARKNTR